MKKPQGHPENDLGLDLDSMNKQPPVPQDFDALADAPDPAWLAAQNKRSTRQAWLFTLCMTAASLLVGLGSLVIFRGIGGPDCTAGQATWLCSPTQRMIWAPLALVLPAASVISSGIILMRKLNSYIRWYSWMGVFWFFVLFLMLWAIDAIQVLLAP